MDSGLGQSSSEVVQIAAPHFGRGDRVELAELPALVAIDEVVEPAANRLAFRSTGEVVDPFGAWTAPLEHRGVARIAGTEVHGAKVVRVAVVARITVPELDSRRRRQRFQSARARLLERALGERRALPAAVEAPAGPWLEQLEGVPQPRETLRGRPACVGALLTPSGVVAELVGDSAQVDVGDEVVAPQLQDALESAFRRAMPTEPEKRPSRE